MKNHLTTNSNVVRAMARAVVTVLIAMPAVLLAAFRSIFVWGFGFAWLYFYLRSHSQSKPFDLAQMALWFDALDSTTAAAILGSLITVIGFILAFNVAHASWRSAKLTELRLEAAEETYNYFHHAVDQLQVLSSYADRLIEFKDNLTADPSEISIEWRAKRIIDDTQRYLQAQQLLTAVLSHVHILQGKHHNLLASQPGATSLFNLAKRHLARASDGLYFVAPVSRPQVDYVTHFVAGVDDSGWKAFVKNVDANDSMCLAMAAGLRSLFQSDVIRPNLWWALSAAKASKTLVPPREPN